MVTPQILPERCRFKSCPDYTFRNIQRIVPPAAMASKHIMKIILDDEKRGDARIGAS